MCAMYSITYLWRGESLHDGDEGEEVAIGTALEYEGQLNEPLQHVCSLGRVSCTHDAHSHHVRQSQMPIICGGIELT